MLIYYWNKLFSEKWIEQKNTNFLSVSVFELDYFTVTLVSCIERSEDLILSK